MDAGKRSINDVFNGNRILEIPFFQRAYVWKEEQWERLLQDMEHVSQSKISYFLGSIILKQKSTNSQTNIGDVRILIDGQQRITTLTIFFKVLCLKTNMNHFFDRIFRLLDNNIALKHNHNDVIEFEKIVDLHSLDELLGISRVTEAYNFFKENINTERLDINAILANILFVGIDIDKNEDEQQIFDTINSLGVKLTTGELLKNYFFNRDEIKSYESNWKVTFEKDNECKAYWDKEVTAGRIKRSNLELFFYSYLQIKLQDASLKVKAEDKNDYGKFEGLFSSYKNFIAKYKIPKEQIIKEIKEYAILFSANIDSDVLNRELPSESGIDRINAIIFGLENSTIIPYILFILKNVTNRSERDKIWGYLESFLLRRMVCRAVNKNYNNLFSENLISNNIVTEEDLRNYITLQVDKVNYMPTDDELENGFHHSTLVNKQAAGILYLIESKIRNRNLQSTALLGMNSYSLEHLMPKKWENNWDKITNPDLIVERNRLLLTLGNLAIITASLNSSIRDSAWIIKKYGVGSKNGLNAYASGLETLLPWLFEKTWNEDTIKERADYLYKESKSIWSV